jgi:hypothetical protein
MSRWKQFTVGSWLAGWLVNLADVQVGASEWPVRVCARMRACAPEAIRFGGHFLLVFFFGV